MDGHTDRQTHRATYRGGAHLKLSQMLTKMILDYQKRCADSKGITYHRI